MRDNEIIILTDYKGVFGSKHFDEPYRSGFDKELLKKYFKDYGYKIKFMGFAEVDFKSMDFKSKVVLHTSSEDVGYYYKSYIEDIVLGCELNGANVIPGYRYLRANNNKVFMEIIRDGSNLPEIKNLNSQYFSTLEEAADNKYIRESNYPKVIKLAEGASGRNVELAEDYEGLKMKIKRMCRTGNFSDDLWEYGRSMKHKGYVKESFYRKKFVVQDFIPRLKNDWKVYVFYNDLFIFYRPIFKKRKFKASGGGYDNYLYGNNANIPEGIFDLAIKIRNEFNVPQLSLDIAFDGKQFYLIEFQFLYFGTAGIPYSKEYYTYENGQLTEKEMQYDQEYFYAKSVCEYLKSRL